MAVTVSMPHLGETITEGTILSWAKQPGESIAEDEVLLEISTDNEKVNTEVPSPTAGVIQEILVSAGQTVSVGTPLVVIAEPAEAAAPPAGGSASAKGGDRDTEQDALGFDAGADEGAPSGQTWVTLREAELRTGVARSTLRKWRKRHKIASRTAEGPTGIRVWVPLEAVAELAAQGGTGTVRKEEGPEGTAPTPTAEQEPPRWAIELLSLADVRAGRLLDRLAQAERERADAERDAAIERHKRDQAEAEVARLRNELATVTNPTQPERVHPEPVERSEVPTPYAAFKARIERWNDRRRGRA